jgi:hypothetical protein
MLASTVQFSSYGRSHTFTAVDPCPGHRGGVLRAGLNRLQCDPLAVTPLMIEELVT